MPVIVNLLFHVVSTKTTTSFTVVLLMVSLVSLLVGVGHLPLWLVLMRNKPSSILLLSLSLADVGALLTLPCVLLSAGFQNQLSGGKCVLLGSTTSVTVRVEILSLATLSVRYRIVSPHMRSPIKFLNKIKVMLSDTHSTMALPKVTYINFDGGCMRSVGKEWLFFLVPAFLIGRSTLVVHRQNASLTGILVCLAPCWNPPLYFLLSRPAVRQLIALLPSFFQEKLGKSLHSAGTSLMLLLRLRLRLRLRLQLRLLPHACRCLMLQHTHSHSDSQTGSIKVTQLCSLTHPHEILLTAIQEYVIHSKLCTVDLSLCHTYCIHALLLATLR
ncbi:LOW QUALITY PROTEIN: uncharacterized protein FYW49_007871 [Xenentodon cancila]